MSTKSLSDENQKDVEEFRKAVNMTAKELTSWLKTEESKSVGQKTSEGAESTGHEEGRHLVSLLQKSKSDYSEADVHEMRRVVGYIHRHMAQKPAGDLRDTRWRYSLMNWGHDPLKK